MKNERDTDNRTLLLYETDGMLTEFDAVVIASSKDEEKGLYFVELDRTAFFPEGGGQLADTGVLITSDGNTVRVTDVQTVEGRVYHWTTNPVPEGSKITGRIDEAQRFSRMQNHGAEHLICGLIHNLYGYDNVGFHQTGEGLVIDINGPLSEQQIREVEERANRVVFENVPVTISFPGEEEAKTISYRSKIEGLSNLRLVTIEGYDVCACCAPHVNMTGQFGSIKILSFMPHRGGTRLTMIAGMDAYRDHVMLHDGNAAIMEILSAQRDKTAEAVADANKRYSQLKEENVSLRRQMTELVTADIIGKLKEGIEEAPAPRPIFTEGLDPVGLRNLVNECTKVYPGPVCAFLRDDNGYRYIFGVRRELAQTLDLRALAADFNEKCSGKGGGSDLMVQGTTTATHKNIEGYFSPKV